MNKNKLKNKITLRPIIIILVGIFSCGLIAYLILNIWGITGIVELLAPPPGEGEKAQRGYQVCEPIIEAINAYYSAEGKYPPALQSISPEYMIDIPSEVNDFPIRYQTTPGSYRLEFNYIGPGMNFCTYTPENNWQCGGYY